MCERDHEQDSFAGCVWEVRVSCLSRASLLSLQLIRRTEESVQHMLRAREDEALLFASDEAGQCCLLLLHFVDGIGS